MENTHESSPELIVPTRHALPVIRQLTSEVTAPDVVQRELKDELESKALNVHLQQEKTWERGNFVNV